MGFSLQLPSKFKVPGASEALTEAGALACRNRAFVNEVEVIGDNSEREADSPVC